MMTEMLQNHAKQFKIQLCLLKRTWYSNCVFDIVIDFWLRLKKIIIIANTTKNRTWKNYELKLKEINTTVYDLVNLNNIIDDGDGTTSFLLPDKRHTSSLYQKHRLIAYEINTPYLNDGVYGFYLLGNGKCLLSL